MSLSVPTAGDGRANGVCFRTPGDPGPGAPEAQEADMPLLDLAVLHQLEDELGDAGIARTFANDYISIWDKRLRHLLRSVADNDPDAAMDAVLSMKNSSLMVGGSRLAGLALEFERIIRDGGLGTAQARTAHLAEVGQATVRAIRQGYLGRNE